MPPTKTCPAWPTSVCDRPCCSTLSSPGGCSAIHESVWRRWSRPSSATPWRKATRQRTGRRVRPEPWIRYAALDVELLIELRDVLHEQLTVAGKLEWADEEFAALTVFNPPEARSEPWRRTSGLHRVRDRRRLAAVRELWLERDQLAHRRDLAPGRVLPDAAIVEAALAMPASPAELATLPVFRGGRSAGRPNGGPERSTGRAAHPTATCPS